MICPECGAEVPEGGACRDHFDALLLLEWSLPGGPGEMAHFYAVATYGLQHPAGMGLTAETLVGMRRAVADALAGWADLNAIRLRIRAAADGATRVRRRAGEPAATWRRREWPITVADVLADQSEPYAERVERWARSVCEALEEEV